MTGELDAVEPLEAAEELELAEALRAAWAPAALEPEVLDRIVDLALEDPLAPPTDEEIAESERLRRALEGEADHPALALAEALRTADAPGALDADALDRALRAAPSRRTGPTRRPRPNVVFVAFGAGASLAALAAAIALLLRPAADRAATEVADTHDAAATLAYSRSAAPLFDARFELGEATGRVDRIAAARRRDLRHNRFAAWGVR